MNENLKAQTKSTCRIRMECHGGAKVAATAMHVVWEEYNTL